MKRVVYTLTLATICFAFCDQSSAQRPILRQAARIIRETQLMIAAAPFVAPYPAHQPIAHQPIAHQPIIHQPIAHPIVVAQAPLVAPTHVVVASAPLVQSQPFVQHPVVEGPISSPNYQDRDIRDMHILDRPNRVGHFYGNTVRRLHYTGRLLP